ncbi:MAG: hypothetical protein KDD39_15085 [Bdellovibrionales bacterium]|nr:hypothetical protein [Bdellovibrionales bacterium]
MKSRRIRKPVLRNPDLDGTDQNRAIHSALTAGQTFTSGVSGLLTGIELSLLEVITGPGLNVAVLDFSGGDLSTAPTLGSLVINDSDLGPDPTTLNLTTVTGTFIDPTDRGSEMLICLSRV